MQSITKNKDVWSSILLKTDFLTAFQCNNKDPFVLDTLYEREKHIWSICGIIGFNERKCHCFDDVDYDSDYDNGEDKQTCTCIYPPNLKICVNLQKEIIRYLKIYQNAPFDYDFFSAEFLEDKSGPNIFDIFLIDLYDISEETLKSYKEKYRFRRIGIVATTYNALRIMSGLGSLTYSGI